MSEELELSPEIKEAQERIKEARAELERINSGEATKTEVAAEAQNSAPVSETEMPTLSKQIDELKKELSRRSGEYGSELDKLRKTLQVASDNNAMLVKQMELLKPKKKDSRREDDDEEDDWETRKLKIAKKIPADKREAYDEDSIDVMARVGESAAKQVLKQKAPKYIDERVEELMEKKYGQHLREISDLKEKLSKVENSASTIEFADVVDSMAPGFKKVNGTATIPPDKGWVEFLDSPKDEFMTWREWCDTVKGPKVAAFAFNQYQKTLKPSSSPADAVAGQVSPPKSQASSSNISDGQKKVLSVADYQKFQEDFYSGKYLEEPQKAVQIMELFTAAAREGRLK